MVIGTIGLSLSTADIGLDRSNGTRAEEGKSCVVRLVPVSAGVNEVGHAVTHESRTASIFCGALTLLYLTRYVQCARMGTYCIHELLE